MPSVDKFAERMRYWCGDATSVGYDQTQRWDIFDGGETDCSAITIFCLREAGFDTGDATYTGDMAVNLVQRGWESLAPDIALAQPGDILLNDTDHVAVVVEGYGWDAKIAEAWGDEKGGIYYGQAGDQTGWETHIRNIYSYPWDRILRYKGEDDMTPEDLIYKNVATRDSGNLPIWQLWSWGYTYSKDAAVELAAMNETMKELARNIGADPDVIASKVESAVTKRLAEIKSPEIDYEQLAAEIAKAVPSAPTVKEIANEVYKRMKA